MKQSGIVKKVLSKIPCWWFWPIQVTCTFAKWRHQCPCWDIIVLGLEWSPYTAYGKNLQKYLKVTIVNFDIDITFSDPHPLYGINY